MKRSISVRTYLMAYLMLLGLAAATAWISTLRIGIFGMPVAMGIAGVKALIIALYFMHLRVGNAMNRTTACAALLWLAILFGLSMNDFLTRNALLVPGK